MHDYCKLWHLSVNTDKIKIVVFSRNKLRNKPVFYFNNAPLEAVDDFNYLGVKLNESGSVILTLTTIFGEFHFF